MVVFFVVSCKKNDPIADLGTTNNEYAAQLRVSYNNTKVNFGDTLIVTASTWQRDDRFQKVGIYDNIVESFGIDMTLKQGTHIITKSDDVSTLTVVDSIVRKNVLLEVGSAQMDNYWVTHTNNYVIPYEYEVEHRDGSYPNDPSLITKLNDQEWDILKGLLAYNITKADYLLLFPTATPDHFTNGGTYVLSAKGMANLKAELERDMLVPIVTDLKKVGNYSIVIDVDAVTPTNTKTSSSRTFDIKL